MTETRQQPHSSAARERVDQALSLDRNGARVLQLMTAQVGAARADADACPFALPTAVSAAANRLEVAIAAQVFATDYQASCHTMLSYALDDLAGAGLLRSLSAADPTTVTDPATSANSAAAVVVVAEATAIAAAAEERLAAQILASTVRATETAHDATMAAAATVAQAAEDARRARSLTNALAAVDVATAAAIAAADVQRRAEVSAAVAAYAPTEPI